MRIGIGIGVTMARVSSFSPAALQGLLAWYDPSDLSTLFQDDAMTVPVTASGQAVAAMKDKSGNARHMVQQTAAARPTYGTDGTLHWLAFDGVDDSMSIAAFAWGSDEATLLLGVRKDRDSAIGCLLETSDNSNNYAGTLALFMPSAVLNAGIYEFRSKGAAQAIATAIAPSSNTVLTSVSKIASDQALLRLNGVQVAAGSADQGSGSYGSHAIYIGRRNNTNFPILGRIYGIALYNTVLAGADIAKCEAWMSRKSGVAL